MLVGRAAATAALAPDALTQTIIHHFRRRRRVIIASVQACKQASVARCDVVVESDADVVGAGTDMTVIIGDVIHCRLKPPAPVRPSTTSAKTLTT